MLNVCVIGLGPIGNRHSQLVLESPLAELVGVCDILHERADAAAAAYGVKAFYDVPAMLRSVKPDICIVATGGAEYGSDHCAPTVQALEARCHVLGEKPISNDIGEAEKMVATARAMGVCYGINLNHRFTPAAQVAKRWQQEGRLGHLLFVNMSMWIMNPRESSPYFQITGGRFVIEDMYREVTLYPAGNLEKTVYTNPLFGGMRDFEDTFRNRQQTFFEQVAAGVAPAEIDGSGADGLAAQKVLAAAIESLEHETVVYVR
jgi:predicted dehydrogenase